MNSLAAKLQSGFEPIAGYFLRDKLGAGGYGEVWSADAPGGLKKAIKFVYGNIEGDRASSELKSLQRIRQVNHPFILSLERIEIIDGQLMIVSELAQGSLYDRYMEFRRKQIAGIPRDRLLSYLADAADGLDFLCQKHDLQHLDVKPGNLLLLSDRIKVADFGLVKDLQSATQSMLAGMTPTYAAPEMFDGRPGRFSDQYSIAIVYQEMLTGELPFRGRTTAQLANEHLNRAPDLNPLPTSDRSIIAKALAKRPQQRFSDCRELINALIEAPKLTQPEHEPIVQARGWSPRMNAMNKLPKQASSRHPQSHPASGPSSSSQRAQNFLQGMAMRSSARSDAREPKKATSYILAAETATGTLTERTVDLIVGIGGKGCEIIARAREKIAEHEIGSHVHAFLAIDTDHKSLEPLVDRSRAAHLDYGSIVHIPIKSPHYYRSETEHFPQLSRRWVYNIPRSQLTEGVRPLGMLALLDHAGLCHDKLLSKIEDIYHSAAEDKASITRFSIQLVSSASGGTGGAIVSEIGFLVRHMTESIKVPVDLNLLLLCSSPNPLANADLSSASAISCLLEISHYFRTNGLHPALPGLPENVTSKPPFDRVELLYGGQAGRRVDEAAAVEEAAVYITKGIPILRVTPSTNSAESGESGYPWLSTVAASSFDMSYILDPKRASLTLMLDNVLGWVHKLDHYTGLNRIAVPVSQLSSKTAEKIEFLVNDLFRSSGWNAQAWVRECMSTASSSSVKINESIGTEPIDAPELGQKNDRYGLAEMTELSAICDSLGADSVEVRKAFETLLQDAVHRIQNFFCEKWLTQPQQWGLLPSLADYVASKLKIQINSLFTVAQKLANQHDVLLEQSDLGAVGDASLQSKLSRLYIESQFHALAGRLLGCVVQFLDEYQGKWLEFSKAHAKDLLSYAIRLCNEELNQSIEDFLEDKPSPRTDRQAKMSVNWLNSLLVRQWDRFCGFDVWLPDENRWPKCIEEDGLQDTALLLNRLLDLLNESFAQESKAIESEIHSEEITVNGTIFDSNLGHEITSTTAHENWSSRIGQSENGAIDSISELNKRLREGAPYLVEFGGNNRQILQIPDFMWHQIPKQTREAIQSKCEVRYADHLTEPILISVGTELDLENLVDRLFMPTTETWNLVPRILSRVDVDWIPFLSAE